jgi:cytidine deaminase
MSVSDEELISRAQHAQQNAYAPYSQFKVGAAILSEDGQVFTGCNVENSTFGATSCAERNAVYCAVCTGAQVFTKIIIVTDSEEPVMPCGICRQVLYEFNPNIEIIAVSASGKTERTRLSAIFPRGLHF